MSHYQLYFGLRPSATDNPVAFVNSANISAEAKSMILGGNAAKLLGILA